jgi:trehalose-phosphatase
MIPHLLDEAAHELDAFAQAPARMLVLDYDGTLAPFAPTPGTARIDPTAQNALERLMARSEHDAWIGVASGRRIDDLRRRLPPLHFLIGLHGLEVALDGEPYRLRFDPEVSDKALDSLRQRLEPIVRHGARIEDKQHSIAVHVRGLDPAPAAAAVLAFEEAVEQERLAGAPLECMRGHLVVEARPVQAGKHRAIEEVRTTLGAQRLAILGDDITDEEAFRAYPSALTVVVMSQPRPTAARFYLRSPEETGVMLSRLSERSA